MNGRKPDQYSGYTGDLLEAETVGAIRISPDQRRELLGYLDDSPEYMKFREATNMVVRMSEQDRSFDAKNPKAFFAKDVYQAVSAGLKLGENDFLGFYSAILAQGKTSLDVFHGVDAFFKLKRSGQQQESLSTLNITINPRHTRTNANILIVMPAEMLDPALEEDKEAYFKKVADTAQAIIDIFQGVNYYNGRKEV